MPSSSSDAPVTQVAPLVANQMPNQARTLLLNQSGANRNDSTFFGEEYVPPYFRPVSLTSGLLTVRSTLFGTNPDAEGLNYSLAQYMRILHSTEYAAYVTELDSRITYLNSDSLVDYPFGPVVSPDDDALYFAGSPNLGGADGKLATSWSVEIIGSQVTITNLQSQRAETTTVVIENGLTEFVPMTDYPGYTVRINTTTDNSLWIVNYMSKPGAAMSPINRAAQLSRIGTEALVELFPPRDPYKLFKELWEKHTEFSYRLSGALLALVYRTNELRVSGI